MKNKIVTFSFDDGIQYDAKLVKLLNKYGLKCTFNINTGLFGESHEFARGPVPIEVHRPYAEELREIYKGHEIASHSLTHQRLEQLAPSEMELEVEKDIENIKGAFLLPMVPCFAYPYGTYSGEVLKILRRCGVRFARAASSTKGFSVPTNLLEYRPTAHYRDEDIFDIIDRFIALKTNEKAVLCIWGHSYEIEGYQEWDRIEEIFSRISGHEDIDYLTNGEAFLGDDSGVYGK